MMGVRKCREKLLLLLVLFCLSCQTLQVSVEGTSQNIERESQQNSNETKQDQLWSYVVDTLQQNYNESEQCLTIINGSDQILSNSESTIASSDQSLSNSESIINSSNQTISNSDQTLTSSDNTLIVGEAEIEMLSTSLLNISNQPERKISSLEINLIVGSVCITVGFGLGVTAAVLIGKYLR